MEQFSIGRVFSRSFALIRDSISSVGLFILILLGIEAAVGLLLQPMMIESLTQSVAGPAENAAFAIFGSTAYWGSILLSMATLGLGWAGGIHGLLQQGEKGSSSLQDCFQAGIAGLLPVLGLIILWWLGVMIGWIFLIVPAAILASMWAIAVPAQVGEGLGVFAAFARSRELTRGHRLSIFGVLVLLIILYYVLMIVIAGSMIGFGSFITNPSLENLSEMTMSMVLFSVPIGWVSGMLIKAIVVSLYLETVLVKEGARTDGLSQVFG